jgi:tetratricopeptide (TPR) repeat protein
MAPGKPKPYAKPIASLRDIPDAKAMQAFVTAYSRLGALQATARAQPYADEAWALKTPKSRLPLLAKSLDISPLCADAYSLLGEILVLPPADTAIIYERGVTAASIVLGPENVAAYRGEFWTFLETRPYMRALYGLATTLFRSGKPEKAIPHFEAMLALNPNDDQNAAPLLLACLLQLDRDRDAAILLNSYTGDPTIWAYTHLLVAYRRGQAETEKTAAWVKKARRANPHIPLALAGQPLPPPTKRPQASPQEAAAYAAAFGPEWARSEGALTWLTRTINIRA